MKTIFNMLVDVQTQLALITPRGFRAQVVWSPLDNERVLRIEHPNPGGPWALLDAAGDVFGGADRADGCESCGHDSAVTVPLERVAALLDFESELSCAFTELCDGDPIPYSDAGIELFAAAHDHVRADLTDEQRAAIEHRARVMTDIDCGAFAAAAILPVNGVVLEQT